jgi:O-antigen/teichoic acid export membrane protein
MNSLPNHHKNYLDFKGSLDSQKSTRSFSSILHRGFVISITNIVARVVNLLTVSAILRVVGETHYGIYQYHLSLVTIAATVGLFGTNALLFREFSVSLRNACRWLFHGLLIRNSGMILSLGAMYFFSTFAIPRVQLLMLIIVSLVVFIEFSIQLNSSWFKALRRPRLDFFYTISRGIVVLFAVIVILMFLPNQYGIALGYSIGGMTVLSAIFCQWWRPLRLGSELSFQWRHAFSSASVILLLEVLGSLSVEIPSILLGWTATFTEVGIYAVYYRLCSPFSLLCVSYDQAFQPDLNRLVRTNKDYAPLLKRGLVWMGVIGLVSGLLILVFVPLGIYLVGQGEVKWKLVALFSLFPIISGYAAMIDNTMIALRRERYLLLSHTIGLIALVLTFFLIPYSSVFTAVVAFLVGFSVKGLVAAMVLKSSIKYYEIS